MDALLPLLLGLAIGLALGLAGGLLVARAGRTGATDHTAALRSQLAAAEATAAGLRDQADAAALAHREQATFAREQFGDQLARQDAQYRAQLATERERIADLQARLASIQDAAAARAADDSKVLVALSPVQESLRAMQLTVTELETQRRQQHGELSEQLRSATESEERLRATAESLASALRSNSTRGVWGETQLRSVVEAAGLIERVDFDVQTSITSDTGAGRPDLVVHLPGGKNIAVDAKVPFDAYLEASAIPASSTGEEGERRAQLMKKHVAALKAHIVALGAKGYWNGLESSPELVIAFIPSESLVSGAMEADPTIMDFAFARKVALASPVTLWSILKSVALSWQQDVLTEDARQLFDLSKELYTRLGTTAGHIDKLGNTLERSVKDYNAFIGSLERKVYPTARRLAALSSENLFPERRAIEESPREITARELLAALEGAAAEPGTTPAGIDALGGTGAIGPLDGSATLGALDETDEQRAAEAERAAAELDALGNPSALRDAAYLDGEAARIHEVEIDLDDPDDLTGTA